MNQWEEIKDYLLHHAECKDIHKMVWWDFAMLTERDGTRHRIESDWPLDVVKRLVKEVFIGQKYYNNEKD